MMILNTIINSLDYGIHDRERQKANLAPFGYDFSS